MNEKHLNIIALNIPYPPDYGGVIDIFYKIKSLYNQGVRVQLHCFQYGRDKSNVLKNYCENVYYYKRNKGLKFFLSLLPYIVITRSNKELLKNLKKNEYPILFEGLHTTYFANHIELSNRKKFIRHHNIEHEYYFKLAKSEKNIFEKIYLFTEAAKLKRYFNRLKRINCHLAISENDRVKLEVKFKQTLLVPAFHSNESISCIEGKSDYILYHGNLSVPENINAVIYLIKEVFTKIQRKVIIAGKNPSKHIEKIICKYENIILESNPGEEKMHDLIRNAHINILITFQSTGLKLKLLNALYNGRFCIVNDHMINNTGLDTVCTIANSPDQILESISSLIHEEFLPEMIGKRKILLESQFSNELNALIITELL